MVIIKSLTNKHKTNKLNSGDARFLETFQRTNDRITPTSVVQSGLESSL